MKDVVISAILYNDSGEVVGSGFTLSLLIVIPPGEKSPFNINIDKWEGETNYKLQAEGHNASMPRQDIIITVNKSKIIGKWLHILGEIKNISTTNAFYVEIIVTLYNDSNNVIGCGYSLSNIEIISPGGTSPFDVSTNHWDGFDHYDIQIQAKYQAE
jgi:hypothetical protein